MLSYSGRHMDRAGVSTIAVNGVVYGKRDDMGPGQRVWVEEEPWFLPGHGWYSRSFPVRFEDGMLDWDRLSQDARKEVARADAFMRRTYGITSPPPPVEAPAPGVPCELGWLMPIVRCPARLEVRGRAHAVRLSNEFNVIEGEGGNFALKCKARNGDIWFVVRADGLPWALSPEASYSRVPSVWVDVDMWLFEGDDVDLVSDVVRPNTTVRGRLRTIYLNRKWRRDEARYGTQPGAGTPRRVETPLVWCGEPWWKNDLWWKGLYPATEDGKVIDHTKLSPVQSRVKDLLSDYHSKMSFWDEPIEYMPPSLLLW